MVDKQYVYMKKILDLVEGYENKIKVIDLLSELRKLDIDDHYKPTKE